MKKEIEMEDRRRRAMSEIRQNEGLGGNDHSGSVGISLSTVRPSRVKCPERTLIRKIYEKAWNAQLCFHGTLTENYPNLS